MSIFNKTFLIWRDRGGKERLQSIGDDFRHYFVGNITEGDGTKYGNGGRVGFLRN